jgi:hypothetical protein
MEEVIRNYLEIKSLKDLLEVSKPTKKCQVFLVDPVDFQLNKFFYKQIGRKHNWVDRLVWEDKKWIDYINNPNIQTYVLKQEEDLIGYFELIFCEKKQEIEIAYFGILEDYFGKKLGGFLLSEAIKKSFLVEVKRVWVHTCSLDHQNALKNYLARGMTIFKSEVMKREIA